MGGGAIGGAAPSVTGSASSEMGGPLNYLLGNAGTPLGDRILAIGLFIFIEIKYKHSHKVTFHQTKAAFRQTLYTVSTVTLS